MRIEITKGVSDDAIAIRRGDGSTAETRFPKKGPIPHDAVHFFVEQALGLQRGFWGMVDEGRHPEEIAEIAKAAGHASAKRFGEPGAGIVELLQAERIVECYEADLWSQAAFDAGAFADFARIACESSLVPMPLDFADKAESIHAGIAGFAVQWKVLAPGQAMCFDWREGE